MLIFFFLDYNNIWFAMHPVGGDGTIAEGLPTLIFSFLKGIVI